MLNSWSTVLKTYQNLSSTCLFSISYITVFLSLEALDSTLTLCFVVILNHKITNSKHKYVKSVTLYRPHTYCMRAKMRVQTSTESVPIEQFKFLSVKVSK